VLNIYVNYRLIIMATVSIVSAWCSCHISVLFVLALVN